MKLPASALLVYALVFCTELGQSMLFPLLPGFADQFALSDARYDGKIVPVLRRDCEFKRLSWTLPSFQIVDFRGDFHAGSRELLRIWGLGYSRR